MKAVTTKKLTDLIVNALEDLKAFNIQTLDVTALTSITDVMIIASGRSNRQVKALADQVQEKIREAGLPLLGMEGDSEAEWILIDAGDVVLHIMQPATRDYYQLEKLWKTEDAINTSKKV